MRAIIKICGYRNPEIVIIYYSTKIASTLRNAIYGNYYNGIVLQPVPNDVTHINN